MKPLEGLRILVVEDDYYLATDACDWLQQAGAEVVGPVVSGEKALDLLDQQSVDGAVLDINLGHGPDYEVARRLHGEQTPFLFTTGYGHSVLPREFEAAQRLEKPFRGQQLITAMEQITRDTKTNKGWRSEASGAVIDRSD